MFNAVDQLSRMNKLFNEMDRPSLTRSVWGSVNDGPGTNLYDGGDSFTMQIEVPGVSKEDLNLRLQGKYLELSGKRETKVPEGYSAHRVERGKFSFSRSFTLPDEIDSTKVEANLENGVLTLVLPKAEAAKPRQISIH
jgi:HSP20 family protein